MKIRGHRDAAVVDLSPHHDRILLIVCHGREPHPELFRKQRPRDFDKAQIGNVKDDGRAVGVENITCTSVRMRGALALTMRENDSKGPADAIGNVEGSLGSAVLKIGMGTIEVIHRPLGGLIMRMPTPVATPATLKAGRASIFSLAATPVGGTPHAR